MKCHHTGMFSCNFYTSALARMIQISCIPSMVGRMKNELAFGDSFNSKTDSPCPTGSDQPPWE